MKLPQFLNNSNNNLHLHKLEILKFKILFNFIFERIFIILVSIIIKFILKNKIKYFF